MTTQDTNTLCTPAWLLLGLGNKPGVLELAGGRLMFTADDGRVFEAPLAEVTNIRFPWYYFGGGVKLSFGEHKYRISFVRPNRAAFASDTLLAQAGARAGAAGLLTGGNARKAWRAALGA